LVKGNHVLSERLKLLDEYINDLKDLQEISFQEYQENKLIHRTVERTLHLAIEACLDIGQHIIAQNGFRTPVDNKDIFVVLHEEGILSADLLEKTTSMARFRNLIVHNYARIDNAAVFGILKRHLDDFNAYAQAVLHYLDIGE
jgi:uncharacterized protein YutE (UPF0331/DUF86 family)